MATYARLPVTFDRGEGAWLWDTDGRPYLDALSGIAVCGLGHAHPAVTHAVCQQAGTLVHTSNLYGVALQERLAEHLGHHAGMDRAFFANSGAEANEAAIKLARLYGHRQGIEAPSVVVTDGAFHGRTLATLSATGNAAIRNGFEPLVEGFERVPYNDPDAIDALARTHPGIVAVLVEPVQGEAGVVVPDTDYLTRLRTLCDRHGWLLMLDEVQTGMGRTGRWFGYQHEAIAPDVMTLAKSLGNGVPIAACLARGTAAEVYQPGQHASTFGGGPLACRAALAVIETLERQALPERAAGLGERIRGGLAQRLGGLDGVVEVRGRGLMIGVELDRPCKALMQRGLERGILLNVTAERTVRLLPPLIVTDEEAERIVELTASLVEAFLEAPSGKG